MTDYNKNVSENIADANDRRHWIPDDGWMGLIPGRSSVEDARKKLGPCSDAEMANGWSYDFQDGAIRVTVIEDQPYISKIWVSRDLQDQRYMPRTLEEARTIFGALAATNRGALSEVFFEAPGVRLAVLCDADPESVLWMELYHP